MKLLINSNIFVSFCAFNLALSSEILLESSNINAVNIIYNYADLINKTAFGLVIWAAAIKDSEASA